MTRGKFAIIMNRGVYTSYEFNGDMYVSQPGHGEEVVSRLEKVNNSHDFVREVEEFNNKNFKYDDEVNKPYFIEDKVNFCKDSYYEKYFSDYIYLKNLTEETKEIIGYHGEDYRILPNQILVFHFGQLVYRLEDGKFVSIE